MEDKLSESLQSFIQETKIEKSERELKALLFEKVDGSLRTLDDLDN